MSDTKMAVVIGNDDFTVSIVTDYEWTETCQPLAIGVDEASAKSIRRHYTPKCSMNQTVMIISRKYCLNHEDFEKVSTLLDEEEE